MNKFLIAAALVGCCLAMPQGQSGAPIGDPYVKILNLESFQNGADYGHALQQEDGTASGQKIGPDGLVYGFYSYIQQGGNPVKVYYRAGKGVGYEVLKVEGLDEKSLGNLKPTISATPYVEPIPREQPATHIQNHVQLQPVQPVQPAQLLPVVRQPVVRQQIPVEPTPAPHRFDYPANLNVQRHGTGFSSSFTAL